MSGAARRLPAPRPGSAGAWWLAARPKTLPAALTPVLVGSAAAAGVDAFAPLPALLAAGGATLIQVGTNLVNDVQDFERGADDPARLGPLRATQGGLLATAAVRRGAAVAFAGAAVCGAALALLAGWPVVVIGVASIAAGLAYTAGPFPLAYNGLGDAFVMLFFGGVAVCGTAWVQAGHVPAAALWASVPIGALATAILAVNNVRDVEGDRRAGKRTLPVLLGRRAGTIEYGLLLALAHGIPLLMLAGGIARPWVLLTLLPLPESVRLACALAHERDGEALNRVLADTARLLLVFGALFSVALAAGRPA